MDFSTAILTDHAANQLDRRSLTESDIRAVLSAPDSIEPVREGRVVAQAMIDETHLLRVFVDIDRDPAEIVTAYRTSKLSKYRTPEVIPPETNTPESNL